jgi:hypothetical protein
MKSVIAVGAQTERRGDAWPARGLLGGKDLAGRLYSEDQKDRGPDALAPALID